MDGSVPAPGDAVVSCHVEAPLDDAVWPLSARDVRRAREEAEWLRASGVAPTLFCGGAWYIDLDVAELAAEVGYADCTALAFRPPYLERGRTYLHMDRPAWLRLPSGSRLLEL